MPEQPKKLGKQTKKTLVVVRPINPQFKAHQQSTDGYQFCKQWFEDSTRRWQVRGSGELDLQSLGTQTHQEQLVIFEHRTCPDYDVHREQVRTQDRRLNRTDLSPQELQNLELQIPSVGPRLLKKRKKSDHPGRTRALRVRLGTAPFEFAGCTAEFEGMYKSRQAMSVVSDVVQFAPRPTEPAAVDRYPDYFQANTEQTRSLEDAFETGEDAEFWGHQLMLFS